MASDGLQYDAVVVGVGHNRLVCAAYLARAGMKTVVLERRHLVGGAAVTEEVWPGFGVSTASYVVSLMSDVVVREQPSPGTATTSTRSTLPTSPPSLTVRDS